MEDKKQDDEKEKKVSEVRCKGFTEEKKPKIRFAGFTDDWKQCKLGDLVTFSKGSGYSKGDLKEEGTPIILYGRLYTKYETVISDVDTFVIAKDNSVYSKGGEVIVPGSGETAEDISIASVVEKSGVLLGGDLNVIIPPKNIDSAFLAISISNGKPHSDMAKMAQGKSVVHLHNSDLAKIDFLYPSYEEQCKISGSFSKIDNLIILYQRKCDELKEVKKYMLQKMFPKNGETKPEIRFAGFTDDWKQRKLGEVLERRIEYKQQSEQYPRLAFASGQGVIPLSERKTNNREQLIKDEFTKQYLVTELDDIVYNPANVKYGAVDRNKCGRGLISPIYVTFTTKEIPGFIERIVTSHDFQQKALRFEEGTVTKRQSVNPEDLITLDILVAPQKDEQKKISSFFDTLDNLINLYHRKCDELKELKKYMLQNMFPRMS